MFLNHTFNLSPLKKHQTISYSQQSSPSIQYDNQKITQLSLKFNSINSTIDLDSSKINFNLVEYQKEDDKIKYDPQMMNAKLRRLENIAQINRIQMELDNRRKKKRHSLKSSKVTQFQHSTYQQTYKSFLLDGKLMQLPLNDSESQAQDNQVKPKGISRFHQLKKHSKLLQFTLQKIRQKQQSMCKPQAHLNSLKQIIKNQTNLLSNQGDLIDLKTSKKRDNNNSSQQKYNPQLILQDKYKRLMSMKAKDKITGSVRMNPRCQRLMDTQKSIILQLEQQGKYLSKDNHKRLKSRFVQLVNQLSKGDKPKDNLPRIKQKGNSKA